MVGMGLLALLALQSAWQARRLPPEPAAGAEPNVPTAHW
jgi:hypothetical protein